MARDNYSFQKYQKELKKKKKKEEKLRKKLEKKNAQTAGGESAPNSEQAPNGEPPSE